MRKKTGFNTAWTLAVTLITSACIMGGCAQSKGNQEDVKMADRVVFSQESGDYTEPFELTLTSPDKTIYYTLDGTDPTTSKTRLNYSGAIQVKDRSGDANVLSAIDPATFDSNYVSWDEDNKKFVSNLTPPSDKAVDKATVIRAVSQDDKGNYTTVQTGTYFIGSMGEHIQGIEDSCKAAGKDMAIMSITVEPDDLFNAKNGIYVHGDVFDKALENYLKTDKVDIWQPNNTARSLDANYKQKGKEWEKAAHIDYFESDGNDTKLQLQQDCGIRVQGNYSRSDLQKGFRLYARAEYGKKDFKYPFFGEDAQDDAGKVINKYKKLILRNGGNCAFTTKFSDAYWQSLIKELDGETQTSRVCVVYLNGEYWGIYILQEDYDAAYFEEKHGVNKDNVVVYKGDAEALARGYKLDEGTLPEGETDESYYFKDLLSFFKSHKDLESQKDFDAFAQLVDVESMRDYFAMNIWINNKWDWPGKNWSLWKVTEIDDANPYADGHWRFCFYDLDFGGVSGSSDASVNTIAEDNYKPAGLLDFDTDNPTVLMFAYAMTNSDFRADFASALKGMSTGCFDKKKATAAGEVFKNTYAPLYDQFFARYSDVATSKDAIDGGYASYSCIVDFLEERADNIDNMLEWVDGHFK